MCAYTRIFLFRRARIKGCPCISKTLAMKDLSCKQSRCPKRRGICIIAQAGLTANVCAFALYASRNATRHGRHKLCAAGVAPRHIDDPPLECCPCSSSSCHALSICCSLSMCVRAKVCVRACVCGAEKSQVMAKRYPCATLRTSSRGPFLMIFWRPLRGASD